MKEVDARPSDAPALAVFTGSPLFVAEDVLERAGADIPQATKASPARSGVESILGEMQSHSQMQQSHPLSQEELTRAKEELIAAVFNT